MTTGATLTANNLKILADGVILKSEAHLAASLKARWSSEQLGLVRYFLRTVEARARAKLPELRRMLLGYASGMVAVDEPLAYFNDIEPYAEVGGLEAELAGERLPFAETGVKGASAPAPRSAESVALDPLELGQSTFTARTRRKAEFGSPSK